MAKKQIGGAMAPNDDSVKLPFDIIGLSRAEKVLHNGKPGDPNPPKQRQDQNNTGIVHTISHWLTGE